LTHTVEWLDVPFNFKKSCSLRIGPRYDVKCANVDSLSDRILSWDSEFRYLDVHSKLTTVQNFLA